MIFQQPQIQANYHFFSEGVHQKIIIEYNFLEGKILQGQIPIGRYKKLSQHTKRQLICLVNEGYSVIKAAKKLNVNYSTAKSIIQKEKKKSVHYETTTKSHDLCQSSSNK